MTFKSTEELVIPEYINQHLKKNNIEFSETRNLEEAMPNLDVLYMTRVQKERFFNEEDYIRLKDTYVLNRERVSLGKETLIILHTLPRVNEISVEVDFDPRAAYFKQAKYGMYVRMALLASLLGAENE
jgi:aspartate carbamoyltransferase catalytic subunit